jgi:hypothetical protein
MKYLINRKTKEHYVYGEDSPMPIPFRDWALVQADSEGWIAHTGNECPLPDDAPYETKARNGVCVKMNRPQTNRWDNDGGKHDTVAYRPILTNAEPVKASDHGEHDTMQDAMRAISPEYDKACDDFESELSDFIMGSNELKAPDYDPRSVSFNLLDRLKAAHEHAQQIPDLEAELREVLGSMGYDLVSRNPFAQQRHGAEGE